MNKCLFLDRDGVLNQEVGDYTYTLEAFELLPNVPEALKLAKKKGYLLVVISNQGGVAKCIFTKDDVELVHGKMKAELKKQDIDLDEIYYCPHHDEVGKCICRKPNSLMLEKAMARFKIDPKASVFIGDSQRDVEAAKKAGVKGILIASNSSILKTVQNLS